MSYFIFPEFRKKLLNCFYQNKRPFLENKHKKKELLFELFDWKRKFYNFIKNEEIYAKKFEKMKNILKEKMWQN